MIDFTQTKRPEFIQLVLIIAVVCLALGAIIPAASAYDESLLIIDEDLYFGGSGLVSPDSILPRPSGDVPSVGHYQYRPSIVDSSFIINASSYLSSSAPYDSYPYGWKSISPVLEFQAWPDMSNVGSDGFEPYVRDIVTFMYTSGLVSDFTPVYVFPLSNYVSVSYQISGEPDIIQHVSVYRQPWDIPPGGIQYGSAYSYSWTLDRNGIYSDVEFSAPTSFGGHKVYTYPKLWETGIEDLDVTDVCDPYTDDAYYFLDVKIGEISHMLVWNDETPYLADPTPTPTPTPTPVLPPGIIPDPAGLNDTVNFTGWYQDQGFEDNNITAPIYSGLRGWFSTNMIPVFEFFLAPISSLSSMISDSSGTAINAIDDSAEELSSYAAPMNVLGGYVVLLVPDIVWVVFFAALSIGYVVLLIRISTGSIRDVIGRFLGRW